MMDFIHRSLMCSAYRFYWKLILSVIYQQINHKLCQGLYSPISFRIAIIVPEREASLIFQVSESVQCCEARWRSVIRTQSQFGWERRRSSLSSTPAHIFTTWTLFPYSNLRISIKYTYMYMYELHPVCYLWAKNGRVHLHQYWYTNEPNHIQKKNKLSTYSVACLINSLPPPSSSNSH